LLSAVREARASGGLYTFGIPPTYPAVGYGYLELGPKIADHQGVFHYRLLRFQEKPNSETAERYLQSGRFLWNSGMFVWSTRSILREMEEHLPRHLETLSAAVSRASDRPPSRTLREAFEAVAAVSIDYGVMEKARDVRCVAATFRWSDVGSWAALRDHLPEDGRGNAFRGKVAAAEARGNLVFCEDERETVVLVGVDGLVVVRAGDRTLVVHRDQSEKIKEVVRDLERNAQRSFS
jgi:mannose-1-phosphate guanylyltransferase